MWLFFVVAAIRSIIRHSDAAVGAIMPQIVPAEQLTKVNGINGSIQALVNLGAPMVSAAMLSTTAIEMIFFVDVITAVLAVSILLFLLRIPAHAKAMAQQTEGYFKDLSLGIAYIRKHDFLKPFFIFMAIFMIMVAPAAFLTPLQVTRSFGGEYWQLTSSRSGVLHRHDRRWRADSCSLGRISQQDVYDHSRCLSACSNMYDPARRGAIFLALMC